MMRSLDGKVAIITGGSRGIGFATASLFARHGAKIMLWDVLEEEGKQAVKQLQSEGFTANYDNVDVANRLQVNEAVKRGVERHDRIDILINNAGVTRDSSLLKMHQDDWQKVIDINLTGVFNCTQAVAGLMKEQGYGRIISASSIVGLYGNFGQTNYVATKAGVIGMTKTWAKELGRYGITVNCIAPGFILTEMTAAIPEEYRAPLIEKIPVKRAGLPDDIARAYLFLAQEESSFINGICLSVDGGAVA